jgi:hypothetical protein
LWAAWPVTRSISGSSATSRWLKRIFERLSVADTEDDVAAAWIAVVLLRCMYAATDR